MFISYTYKTNVHRYNPLIYFCDVCYFGRHIIVKSTFLLQKRLFCIQTVPVPVSTSQNSKTTCWVPCMASSSVGRRATYSTKSVSTNEPVVSVDWLYDNLKLPDIKVLGFTNFIRLRKQFTNFIIFGKMKFHLIFFNYLLIDLYHYHA